MFFQGIPQDYNPQYKRDSHRSDERLDIWLNRPKLYLELVSGGVAALGVTLLLFSPGWVVRFIAFPTLATATAAYAGSQLIHRNYKSALKEAIAAEVAGDRAALERSQGETQYLQSTLNQMQQAANAQILHWRGQAEGLQTTKAELQTLKNQWLQAQYEWRSTEEAIDRDLKSQDDEIHALENKIEVLQQSQALASRELLSDGRMALASALQNLGDSLERQISEALAQNPKLKPQLSTISDKGKAAIEARNADAAELSEHLSGKKILAEIVDLLRQATREISGLKVMVRNSLNTGTSTEYLKRIQELESQLGQSIPRSQHEAILSEYQGDADGLTEEAVHRLRDLQDKAQSADEIIQGLQGEIEHWQAIAQQYQLQTQQLLKPIRFSPATREDQKMGNAVIDYFYTQSLPIVLDRAGAEYHKHHAILRFHARNGQILPPSELNDHSDKLQQAIQSLNAPKFAYDAESGLFSCEVQLSRKPEISPSEILKSIGNRTDFLRYLENNPIRYRLIGDPESGKTPLATQMAAYLSRVGAHDGNTSSGAKMEKILISASNPLAEISRKDTQYPLAPFLVARNAKESARVITLMHQDYEWRRKPEYKSFVANYFSLWIIDESDNTLSLAGGDSARKLRDILNDGGHSNIGWILLGQSVNTSKMSGWTNDDRKKLTEIVLGASKIRAWANAYGQDYYSPEALDALDKQLQRVSKAIEKENEAIADKAAKLLLVLIADRRSPKLFIAPKFDAFEFNLGQIHRWQTESDDARNQLETAGISLEFPSTVIQPLPHQNNGISINSTIPSTSMELPYGEGHGIDGKTGHCPSCGSAGNPKGKPTSGRQRYFCLNEDCDKKTFTATLEEAIR